MHPFHNETGTEDVPKIDMSPHARSQSLSCEDAPRQDVAEPDPGSAAGATHICGIGSRRNLKSGFHFETGIALDFGQRKPNVFFETLFSRDNAVRVLGLDFLDHGIDDVLRDRGA